MLLNCFFARSGEKLSIVSKCNVLKNATKILVASYATKTAAEQALESWTTTIQGRGPKIEYDHINWSTANLLSYTLDDGFPSPLIGSLRDVDQYKQMNVVERTPVPPCYHLAYFPPRLKERDLNSDGYEEDYFPPAEYFTHRMWVGAKLKFSIDNPLSLTDNAKMTTTLDRTEYGNTGRLGETARVFLNKEISNDHGWCMTEQRCMIYYPKKPTQAPKQIHYTKPADFRYTVNPSSILLFRYSALTFNSHKIHYDHLYSTLEENHPDCLVHGPLSGTVMILKLHQYLAEQQIADTAGGMVTDYEYKCLSPLIVNRPLTVCGSKSLNQASNGNQTKYNLWILNDRGQLAVKGSALIKKKDL